MESGVSVGTPKRGRGPHPPRNKVNLSHEQNRSRWEIVGKSNLKCVKLRAVRMVNDSKGKIEDGHNFDTGQLSDRGVAERGGGKDFHSRPTSRE